MYVQFEVVGFVCLNPRFLEEVGDINLSAIHRAVNSKQAWISSDSKSGKSAIISLAGT